MFANSEVLRLPRSAINKTMPVDPLCVLLLTRDHTCMTPSPPPRDASQRGVCWGEGWNYHLHFTEEKTESQRTHSKPHR